MFYHVEMYQMKCFISNCLHNNFSKLSQIFWCQIALVPNCPGAKLSVFKLLVPTCLPLTFGAKLSYNPFLIGRSLINI